ncbi:hypothetical protein CNX28_08915, partial [Campylobacter jejuni]|nr:hypothetical protein [Campylobacter jejuni]
MQIKIFNSFFFQYGRYLQYDLIHSLQQKTKIGRNVDLLIEFREFFKLLVSSKLKQEEEKEGLDNLKIDIKNYIGNKQQECLDIEIDKISHSTFDYNILLTQDFKNLLSDFCVSCSDFRIIDTIEHDEGQEFAKDKDRRSVLVQALLEFNNALSHIFTSVYHGNDDLGNINKAKNHLYRGTLDNYKMFIRLSIKSVKQKNPKLFEEFKDIRMQELLYLGKDVQGKVINNKYLHKQYKELYNKSLPYLDK